MRSRTSSKIWFLMLIPVVVLIGIGWMQRNNRITFKPPRRQSGPLKMVVTDVKFEELKPREVAEGFDTKVTLTLDLEGSCRKEARHLDFHLMCATFVWWKPVPSLALPG